ncbi:MAG: hypothetical protein ACP5PJ_05975 [Acidimicrobiales bacterium]
MSKHFGGLRVVARLARLREDQAKQDLAMALREVDAVRRTADVRANELAAIATSVQLDFGQRTHVYRDGVAVARAQALDELATREIEYRGRLDDYLDAHRSVTFVSQVLDRKVEERRSALERKESAELFELAGAVQEAVRRLDAKH